MAIYLGNKKIQDLYLGSKKVKEAYLGSKKVYPESPPITPIDPSESGPADYCFYDKVNDKVIIVPGKADLSDYPAESYTPIGIVVVPGTHNVYRGGSCGIMSLKWMSCNTPDTGSTLKDYMCWGVYGINISGLPNLDQVPTGNTPNGIPTGSNSYFAYLPSDQFSDTQCAHDTDTYYYYTQPCIPSPYLTDGSRNPGYYQTSSPSSSDNALADFDGIGNTKKIITKRGTKDYTSWTPGRETEADYPAASCCDMFYTDGTSQGDWYLPACGELGYIMPPFNKLNEAIGNLLQAYGSSVGVELNKDGYWSSTKYSSSSYRCIGTDLGNVTYSVRYSISCVRAFLRVNSNGIVRS